MSCRQEKHRNLWTSDKHCIALTFCFQLPQAASYVLLLFAFSFTSSSSSSLFTQAPLSWTISNPPIYHCSLLFFSLLLWVRSKIKMFIHADSAESHTFFKYILFNLPVSDILSPWTVNTTTCLGPDCHLGSWRRWWRRGGQVSDCHPNSCVWSVKPPDSLKGPLGKESVATVKVILS